MQIRKKKNTVKKRIDNLLQFFFKGLFKKQNREEKIKIFKAQISRRKNINETEISIEKKKKANRIFAYLVAFFVLS